MQLRPSANLTRFQEKFHKTPQRAMLISSQQKYEKQELKSYIQLIVKEELSKKLCTPERKDLTFDLLIQESKYRDLLPSYLISEIQRIFEEEEWELEQQTLEKIFAHFATSASCFSDRFSVMRYQPYVYNIQE